jgi:hypothetical protein
MVFLFQLPQISLGFAIKLLLATTIILNWVLAYSKKQRNPENANLITLDHVSQIIIDWLKGIASNWYSLLSLVIIGVLLTMSQVGIDVVEYLVVNRWGNSFFTFFFYYLGIYFTAIIWATVNWITPQYGENSNAIDEMRADAIAKANRLSGVSTFLILAMSVGLIGQTNDIRSFNVFYFFLMLIFIGLTVFFNSRSERIVGKWLLIAFLLFTVFLVLISVFAAQLGIELLGQMLGLGFLLEGVVFFIFTRILDDKKTLFVDKMNSGINFININMNKIPMFKNKSLATLNRNDDETRQSVFKVIYRIVIYFGIVTALVFVFMPNIQPLHPFWSLIAGVSFMLIVIDSLYFAYFKEEFNFLGLTKTFKGNAAKLIVLGITALIIISFVVTGSEKHFDVIALEKPLKRASMTEAFDKWLSKFNPSDSTIPVFIVAGQGGGSRAAYWISKTLIKLDSLTKGQFHEHCFVISCVSGSAPGAVSIMPVWNSIDNINKNNISLEKQDYGNKKWQSYPENVFSKNYITSGLGGNFFGDMYHRIFPLNFLPIKDRNLRLQEEEAWCVERAFKSKSTEEGEESYFNLFKSISRESNPDWYLFRPYIDCYYDEKSQLREANQLPYFLGNTCNTQTGKRGIVSPFQLEDSIFVDAIDVLGLKKVEGDTLKMSKDTIVNITLGQAANICELFPYLSAVGSIHQMAYGDGGYFENSGLLTASEVYMALCKQVRSNPQKYKKVKPYIIAIINSPSKTLEKRLNGGEITSVGQVSAPLITAFNVPFGGYASKAREDAKRKCNDDYHEIIFKDIVPLTRILTRNNMMTLNKDLDDNFKRLPKVIEDLNKQTKIK